MAPQPMREGTASKRVLLWSKRGTLSLCTLGIVVSVYALYVEIIAERVEGYTALCDIGHRMSCSRVLTSRWGRGFGLVDKVLSKDSILNQPNSIYGLAFYFFQATLAFNSTFSGSVVQLVAAFLANLGSIYLGYILFAIIQDICIICIATYILNFFLLICSIVKVKSAYSAHAKKLR
ncbi:vitamin K epoxide reductase complex subunit 1-like [Pomacea canaliculata]|uniref:vitamin K epoxide reductase complex subunit 1-like n=1 Tax=Pomacea canaliculata TaxID=400727 RepID=UPI000D7328B1|nr:vitamin K epoxide reductase complex subunit 1-like [Pomacea canaliculata]